MITITLTVVDQVLSGAHTVSQCYTDYNIFSYYFHYFCSVSTNPITGQFNNYLDSVTLLLAWMWNDSLINYVKFFAVLTEKLREWKLLDAGLGLLTETLRSCCNRLRGNCSADPRSASKRQFDPISLKEMRRLSPLKAKWLETHAFFQRSVISVMTYTIEMKSVVLIKSLKNDYSSHKFNFWCLLLRNYSTRWVWLTLMQYINWVLLLVVFIRSLMGDWSTSVSLCVCFTLALSVFTLAAVSYCVSMNASFISGYGN